MSSASYRLRLHYELVYWEGCKHGNADGLSRLPLPDTVVTPPVLGETILLMDRLEVMPVKPDHIVQIGRPQTQCYSRFSEELSRTGVKNALTKAWSLSTWGETNWAHTMVVSCGETVWWYHLGVRNSSGLEDLLTSHPGMVSWKIWRGATYGGQGWIKTLKIRSSEAKYLNFIELYLCILASGLKSPRPAYI